MTTTTKTITNHGQQDFNKAQGSSSLSLKQKSLKAVRVPEALPPFTLAEIKRAIPSHCFERSLFTSCLYLLVDLIVISALYYCTQFFDHPSLPFAVSCLLWVAYWLLQGFVQTGLWVIAHECGHGAFSDYTAVNDFVGMICHSFLLVPFWSWKFSHGRHHSKTGSVEYDEVFVPQVKSTHAAPDDPSPVLTLLRIVLTLSVGWFAYLTFNVSGRQYPRPANHFNPYSPIFTPKERKWVVMSDLALLVVLSGLAYCTYSFGFAWTVKVYLIPYLHVNLWLVLITLLQHTDVKLPHFKSNEWTWLRGALCTVDRDYGFLNVFFHHIGDTHVAHHLFSRMPHYHAQEATKAIIPVLGKYYCQDSTPIAKALWDSTRDCVFVRDAEVGALWFTKE